MTAQELKEWRELQKLNRSPLNQVCLKHLQALERESGQALVVESELYSLQLAQWFLDNREFLPGWEKFRYQFQDEAGLLSSRKPPRKVQRMLLPEPGRVWEAELVKELRESTPEEAAEWLSDSLVNNLCRENDALGPA